MPWCQNSDYDYMCLHCDFTISVKSEASKRMLARLHKKKCKNTGRTEKGRKEWDELEKKSTIHRGVKTKQRKICATDDVEIDEIGKKSWNTINSKKSLSK